MGVFEMIQQVRKQIDSQATQEVDKVFNPDENLRVVTALYQKFISQSMPQEMAVWAAREWRAIERRDWLMLKQGEGGLFGDNLKRKAAFIRDFLKPYGMMQDDGLTKLVKSAVPVIFGAVNPMLGAAASYGVSSTQSKVTDGTEYVRVYGSIGSEIKFPEAVNSTSSIASNSITNQNQTVTMLDVLKRWAMVLLSLILGLFSIVYYTRTKNSTDKKKRKPFLFLGIAATAVGAFLTYKKLKAK